MAITNGASGIIDKAKSAISNPFSRAVAPVLDAPDYPGGFVIEEILENSANPGLMVILSGNMMPKVPFSFGGSLRKKKEFYSGSSEPVIQIQGTEEDDVTIKGEFKEKKLSRDLKGVAQEYQELVDSIRLRGNIVKINMGEWERYALVDKVNFEWNKLDKIQYSITFTLFGFFKPTNARYLANIREIPYDVNSALIAQTKAFNDLKNDMPKSVPFSIADAINKVSSEVASAVALVTGFVDTVINAVQDIQKAINRIKGMIKYAQNKLKQYKNLVGSFNPFGDPSQNLAGKYSSAKFYTKSISTASKMTSLLESIKRKLSFIIPNIPLGRHLVKSGETLQKIAVKFYGSADSWKKIYEYNNLESTDLKSGLILEIPRL